MSAKFEIMTAENGKFYFHLKSANGEIIAQSQQYAGKDGAKNGIEAIKRDAGDAPVVDLT